MLILENKRLMEIIEHAVASTPAEVCGLLAGRQARIEKVYRMTNTAPDSSDSYLMDPAEQLRVLKEIRRAELELLGIYHSHPVSAAYPSPRDVELAFYPEAVYVIVSLKAKDKPVVRAFRIKAGEIFEEKIET